MKSLVKQGFHYGQFVTQLNDVITKLLKFMAKGRPKKGLGDVIEDITEATGIKKLVHFIAGEDCGCDERKAKLNSIPTFFNIKYNCLNEKDYNYLKLFFEKNVQQLSINQQQELIDIYYRIFEFKLEHTNCASCWRDIINKIKQVYDSYADS